MTIEVDMGKIVVIQHQRRCHDCSERHTIYYMSDDDEVQRWDEEGFILTDSGKVSHKTNVSTPIVGVDVV